jgi:hypothetical protein
MRGRYVFKFLNDLNPLRKREYSCQPNGKNTGLKVVNINVTLNVFKDRVVEWIIVGKIGGDGLFEDNILEIPDGRGLWEIDWVLGNQIIEGLPEFPHDPPVLFLTHFHYPNIISSLQLL